MAAANRKVQFEVNGIVVGEMSITLKVAEAMLPYLETQGYSGAELQNFLNSRVVDAVNAIDGTVPGVIVSNLEGL